MESRATRPMNWWQFHQLLWQRKLVVAVILALGMALTVAWTYTRTVVYRSEAIAQIQSFYRGSYAENPAMQLDFSRAHRIIAESHPVIERALDSSGSSRRPVSFEARTDGPLIHFTVVDTDYRRAAEFANCWRTRLSSSWD